MNTKNYLRIVVATVACVAGLTANAETTNPAAVVQTMETNFGVHHGYRRNHAKGFCATGEFKASPKAKTLSRSVLFDGRAHAVVARFSSATGLPAIPDTTPVPHGLALQFTLPGGVLHNMSMINAPIFPAATPEAFHESLKLAGPEAVAAYQTKYPESKPFFAWIGQHAPPTSYATASYYSLNAFELVNKAKASQFIRWRFVPAAGEKEMSKEELAKASPNYLEDEFKTRVAKTPTLWTMVATLAEAGDSVTNSTEAWPESRKTVTLGTLTLSKYAPQATGPCDKINFDPTRLSDGVLASNDPVLKFRSPVYGVSFGKRMSDPTDRAPTQATGTPDHADEF